MKLMAIIGLLATAMAAFGALAQHDPKHHMAPAATPPGNSSAEPKSSLGRDNRRLVKFPAHIREHTLASMRDHLKALVEIQEALAGGKFDEASIIAEKRLGVSSFGRHGAHDSGPLMPAEMQSLGESMHRSASRFALVAQEAAVTNDLKQALSALTAIGQTCVACHEAFRLQ